MLRKKFIWKEGLCAFIIKIMAFSTFDDGEQKFFRGGRGQHENLDFSPK